MAFERARLRAVVAAWTLVMLAPNIASWPMWPWVGADIPTPVDVSTQFVGGGYPTAFAIAIGVSAALFALAGCARRYLLLVAPFVAIAPLEVLHIVVYGRTSDATLLGVLVATNLEELREFVGAPFLCAVALAFVLLALVVRSASRLRGLAPRMRASHRVAVALVLGTVVLVGLAAEGGVQAAARRPDAGRNGVTNEVLSPVERTLERAYPAGLAVRYTEYARRRELIQTSRKTAANFKFGVEVAQDAPAIVVLVIGESIRADHFGLNGYARDTTPRLGRLERLFNFGQATSAAGATRESVPYLLTRRPLGVDPVKLPADGSIVRAFREVGFSTWWISSHAPLGPLDDEVAAFAEDAEHRRFVNPQGYARRGAPDKLAVDALRTALRSPGERRFIVLHLLQAHWDYRLRYPTGSRAFVPDGDGTALWSIYSRSDRVAIVNAYDNAVRHADEILAEAIEVLAADGRPAVMLYMSDHGQALFDGSCLTAGHGVWSRTVFNVPLLVWVSKSFADLMPAKVQSLGANASRPVTAESVFPTLVDLGGLHFAGAKPELSLANPSYSPGRRKVTLTLREWIDADRDLPARDCAADPKSRSNGLPITYSELAENSRGSRPKLRP